MRDEPGVRYMAPNLQLWMSPKGRNAQLWIATPYA